MPQEYCLLWIYSWSATCMPRGEWAAWVQAAGALLALYLVLYMAAQARREKRVLTRNAILVFAVGLKAALNDLADAGEAKNGAAFAMHSDLLADLVRVGQAIPIEHAMEVHVHKLIELRTLAICGAFLVRSAPEIDPPVLVTKLRDLHEKAAALAVRLDEPQSMEG